MFKQIYIYIYVHMCICMHMYEYAFLCAYIYMYSKTPLYCPSIHRQTRVSPRISAVPFSVCNNNPVKMPNSHTAIRHGNWRSNGQFTLI